MIKYCFSFLLIVSFLSICFTGPVHVLARETIAFGEIKASGGVQIESSTGRWIDMQPAYPLLKKTKLRTNNGVVFITAVDGSRIDLSRETEASMDTTGRGYVINLVGGTVSFNIMPGSSLTVVTKDATISSAQSVAGYYPLTAGPAAPRPANIQGLVICDSNRTFVKSIAGRITVTGRDLQARSLGPGEIFLASGESKCVPLAGTRANPGKYTGLIQGGIVGAFIISGSLTSVEAFRGNGKVHSKYTP